MMLSFDTHDGILLLHEQQEIAPLFLNSWILAFALLPVCLLLINLIISYLQRVQRKTALSIVHDICTEIITLNRSE